MDFTQSTYSEIFEYAIYVFEMRWITMDLNSVVRNRICELCEERQITINALSNIAGMPASTLKNIISGKGSNDQKISTIKKICDGFGITLGEFFSTDYFDHLEQYIK